MVNFSTTPQMTTTKRVAEPLLHTAVKRRTIQERIQQSTGILQEFIQQSTGISTDLCVLIVDYETETWSLLKKFPHGSPLWLTQWFGDKNHFYSLMKLQGVQMFQANQMDLQLLQPTFRSASSDNAIWIMFEKAVKASALVKSAKMDAQQLKCQLTHKDHKGIPYFQCDKCLELWPEEPRQRLDDQWHAFMNTHLGLIFEYLNQLSPVSQNKLACSLDESWLEGKKDSVRL